MVSYAKILEIFDMDKPFPIFRQDLGHGHGAIIKWLALWS